jgi:hypothetical protein
MKPEEQKRAEGRQICRAIDNYTPLTTNRGEAEAQATLNELQEA